MVLSKNWMEWLTVFHLMRVAKCLVEWSMMKNGIANSDDTFNLLKLGFIKNALGSGKFWKVKYDPPCNQAVKSNNDVEQ